MPSPIEGTKAELQTPAAKKVAYWLGQLRLADKRDKDWKKKANAAVDIYEAEKVNENSYNILYANTETLQPALYAQEPRPVVKQRAVNPLKPNPIAAAAAKFMQRGLEFLVDQGDDGEYENFDELMKQAVLEALVPGRGTTRFKLDSYEKGGPLRVCGESSPWDRIRFGYAKQWKSTPWVAFDHFFTKEELLTNFDKAIVAKMTLTTEEKGIETSEDGEGANAWGSGEEGGKGKAEGGSKLAYVAEIWDKDSRKVIFVSPAYPEGPLKEVDDPLGLQGFFPVPKPLQLFRKIRSQTPVPIYSFYREQHKELNVITQRIMHITRALKVRGVYDARIGELEKVFTLNDNEMEPAESTQGLDPGVTLDKAIWFMPVDKLIQVLQQLYVNRAQVKEIIFELTGIADIMRGSSAASETLGAQQIKERWGGVRLKRMQRETARYARDCMRLMAELAVNKLDEPVLAAMVQLPLADTERKKQAVAALQQAKMLPPGSPGAPPPEQLQQLEQSLQLPSYGEVIDFLRNDKLRSYSLDIETNSTVDLDMTEDKQDIAEMMTAMGQFLNGIGPLVENGSLPFDGAKAMMLAISRRFRFGSEVEDILRGMQAPKPKDDGGQAEAQANIQIKQAETQANLKMKEQEQQGTMQMKAKQMQFDQELAREKHNQDLALARQKAADDAELARQKATADAQLTKEKNAADGQRQEREGQRTRDRQANVDKQQSKEIQQVTARIEALTQTVTELIKAIPKAQAATATTKPEARL